MDPNPSPDPGPPAPVPGNGPGFPTGAGREGVGHLAGAGNQSAAPAALPGPARTRDYPAPLFTADAPTCPDCGSLMTRNGSCYKCENCGATSGCS